MDRRDEHNRIIHELHTDCYACGDRKDGIGLQFRQDGRGIAAEWLCDERFRSYPGIIHGGITATLLDSTMTNCLLEMGVVAVTAELNIRYYKPLEIGGTVVVSAEAAYARPTLFKVEAEVRQGEVLIAGAHAKFMQSNIWMEMTDV